MAMNADKRSSEIAMRRFLICIGASCVLGTILGFVGTQMDWSHGVALAVLAVAGTITCAVTLHTNLFDGLHLSKGMRQRGTRRHV